MIIFKNNYYYYYYWNTGTEDRSGTKFMSSSLVLVFVASCASTFAAAARRYAMPRS